MSFSCIFELVSDLLSSRTRRDCLRYMQPKWIADASMAPEIWRDGCTALELNEEISIFQLYAWLSRPRDFSPFHTPQHTNIPPVMMIHNPCTGVFCPFLTERHGCWQVTEGTVDEGIHALAERKLRLDAAVLDGITASSKQTKAADNLAMSELLENLIAGEQC